MTTECNPAYLDFPMLGPRQVLADFDGGAISSDGGALLLRETERLTGIIRQFAACFTDHRNPDLTEHTAEELIAQRVYALALGYEDLNDHDDLRRDPLLATVVGKADPTGHDLVVNATPAGMRDGDPLPVDVAKLDGKMFVADIITMPLLTPLLAAAQARGCRTQNGQDMFNAQGDFITDFLLGA